jgi:SAM-dependent methyltransferase
MMMFQEGPNKDLFMSDWTAGYVADIGYTFGYYPELNPLRVKLALLNAGVLPPEIGAACELGFGQGVSANLHAAASTVQWYGTDFNPAHAGFAQELAAASGAGARLYDAAFANFDATTDLPDFDYIGLHGIWSWISDANRTAIVDFIRRKLKVGGVLYISYNTQPGWAAMAPMRDLLAEHASVMGVAGQGIVPRIDGALAFAEQLLATQPTYSKANPQVAKRLARIRDQDRNYLAHEYFNRDWLPMSFSRMAQWLAPAKLNYACSAHYPDHVDPINLSAEQRALLKEIPDAMFRQTVRDFMVNQQFRRDYWVKGMRKLKPLERFTALGAQRLVLVQPRADVALKVSGGLGEATLLEAVYAPILNVLADHKPRTLDQIQAAVTDQNITIAQVIEAAMILTGNGSLLAVQDDAAIALVQPQTDKLNAYLMNKARASGEINHLGNPVSGGGFSVNRTQQLFLLARSQGQKQPAAWAQFVWQVFAAQQQKIIKDGKILNTADENLAELQAQAATFAEKQLPIVQALQIAN